MFGLRKRCPAALVAAALVAIPSAPVRAAWMAAPSEGGAGGDADAAPAAVVGLEASAPEQGAVLTRALRRAFAARGLSGGKEVNLAELRLALGCKGTSPACLARGGKQLDARRLVYGTLRREGGGWQLEVTLLEVESGAVTSTSVPLVDADLAADRIDATADAVAERLAPDTAISDAPAPGSGRLAPPPPPPEPEPEPEPETSDDAAEAEPAAGGRGKLWFGWQKPQPKWKLIGFGVSTGVMVVSGGATLGLGLWLTSKSWGFRSKLVEAAESSLTDSNPANDVDPNAPEVVNLCDLAREMPDPNQPSAVRNAAVARICNDADDRRTVQIGTGIATAVSGVSTLVFTLLLLVHRRPAPESAWRRHRLLVGMDPVPGQGLSLRLGGRF